MHLQRQLSECVVSSAGAGGGEAAARHSLALHRGRVLRWLCLVFLLWAVVCASDADARPGVGRPTVRLPPLSGEIWREPHTRQPGHQAHEAQAVQLSEKQEKALSESNDRQDSLMNLPASAVRSLLPVLTPEKMEYLLGKQYIGPDSEIARFMRDEAIAPHAIPADAGARLVAWVMASKIARSKDMVRALSSADKWLLDTFIETKRPGQAVNFDSEVRYWEAWQHARKKQLKEAQDLFPALGEPGAGVRDMFAGVHDQHEARYLRQAHAAYIAAHPALARLQSEGWNLDRVSLAELSRVLDFLVRPLPGEQPVLTYFIHPKAAEHDLMTADINAAWRTRSGDTPSYLLHNDIPRFLDTMRGRTVILVGHITDQYFAMDRGQGRPALMLHLPELIRTAEQYGVMLIPIGCNSARAGAPFGFTRTIDSIEVAKFVGAIARDSLSIADLLAAMGRIGAIAVDATAFADYIDVTLRPAGTGGEPVSLVRIPVKGYPSSVANNAQATSASASYQEFTGAWIAAARPWHDRGWLAWVRSLVRMTPGAGLLSVALALAALGGLTRLLRRSIEGTLAPTGTWLYVAECWFWGLACCIGVLAIVFGVLVALWAAELLGAAFWALIALGLIANLADWLKKNGFR